MNTIPTEQKAKVLEETRERLKKTSSYVVMDYRGMTVSQMSDLRRELRKSNVELEVIKNTLFGMAARDTGVKVDESILQGPTAVAFAYDDPVAAARVLTDFIRTNPKVTIKGGGVENNTLTPEQVAAFAKTPPRQVLLSQMAGVLQAPMSQTAAALNALASQMARLLQALADKQNEGATA